MPFLLTLVFNWQLCGSIHSHKRKRNNKCGFIIWIQARSGVAHFHKKHPVHSFWHKVVPYIPETMKSETVVKQWKQSCLTLCDPMDCSLAHAPPSMGFCRQEYWSGLPCPPPGDLAHPGIKARSPALEANSIPSEPPGKPLFPLYGLKNCQRRHLSLNRKGLAECLANFHHLGSTLVRLNRPHLFLWTSFLGACLEPW